MKTQSRQRGFSMIELGVALVVLGLLAVGFVAYWRMAVQEKSSAADRDLLEVAERALVGFAHANSRLPCPAADSSGSESCGAGQVGMLPWRALGLADNAARQLKYGVYRAAAPATTPWLDMDLAVKTDRLPPMFTVGFPPVMTETPQLAGMLGAANLIDFCYGANSAANAPVNAAALAVATSASAPRRAVAFVVAAPGQRDADGDGSRFDGLQATATSAAPTFDAANRPRTSDDDDRVIAMSFDGLFAQLGCGQALSAISHSHVAAATAAAFTQQGLVNYERQMEINKMIADGGVAQATAGVLGAVAGLADAVANSANAVALTILSYGATSAVLAPAIAAIVANTIAVGSSAGTLAVAVRVLDEAKSRVTRAGVLVDTTEALATSIKANAVAADNRGF